MIPVVNYKCFTYQFSFDIFEVKYFCFNPLMAGNSYRTHHDFGQMLVSDLSK